MTLDGNSTRVNTKVENSPEMRQTLVYYRTGLNEDQMHNLTVTMLGGDYIHIDRVDITLASGATTSNSTAPHTSQALTTMAPSSIGVANPGVMATQATAESAQSKSRILV